MYPLSLSIWCFDFQLFKTNVAASDSYQGHCFCSSSNLLHIHTHAHIPLSYFISLYRNVGSCLYDGIVRNVICMLTELIQCRLILSAFPQRWKETWGFINLFERTTACSSGEHRKRKGPDILQRYAKLQDCCVLSWKRFIPRQHFSQL